MKIDIHNYEAFMLSLVDNELNEQETKALMLFLEEHPELQHELTLLQATKLLADEKIIFTSKNSLYREGNNVTPKVFFLRRHPWLSVAAAACLLLLVTLLVHPWKKQTLIKEMAVNTLSVQKNQLPISTPANSGSNEIIHEQNKPQGKTLAIHQTTKNKIHSLPKIIKSNAIAQNQPEEVQKPELPAALPNIQSSTNENNSIVSAENKIPEQLPLENTIHSSLSNKATVTKQSVQKNSNNLIAKNVHGTSEDLIQKVEEWKNKPSKILENIHQNGLKIGKLTIAFNN